MIGFMIFCVLLLIVGTVGLTVFRKPFEKGERPYKTLTTVRTIFIIIVIAIMLLSFLLFAIRIIDATEVGVVRVFGRIDRELSGGLHLVNPISEKVINYDLTAHMRTAEFATYTKDAQPVSASVDYQYKLRQGEVMNVAQEFGSYEVLEEKLNAVVEEKVKAVFAKYGGMSLLENRATLSDEVYFAIRELEATYHVEFINAVVNNIDFSDAFEASVEAKMTAEQEALRAEQEKKTAVVNAEKEREVARIEAEAAVAKAEGEVNAAIAMAEGEAEAMRITREALENMPDNWLTQLWIDKWNGDLPQIITDGSDLLITPSIG